MFEKGNRETLPYHIETHFLEKDLVSDSGQNASAFVFLKIWSKTGKFPLNAKLFVTLGSFPQT